MSALNEVLRAVLPLSETDRGSQSPVGEAIWSQVVSILGNLLLADKYGSPPPSSPRGTADKCSTTQTPEDEQFVLSILDMWSTTFVPQMMASKLPQSVVEQVAEILSKGSTVYHYDVPNTSEGGGTTATAVAEPSEELAYWAFDLLVSTSSSSTTTSQEDGESPAAHLLPALLARYQHTLQRFVLDARLRGRLPFER